MPKNQYIQTFDIGSCSNNGQLQLNEITTKYRYSLTQQPLNVTFKLQLFIPSQFNTLTNVDTQNVVATQKKQKYLIPGSDQTIQVTFDGFNVTLGCNDIYGYYGVFGLYVSLGNCIGYENCINLFDGGGENKIYPLLCDIPSPNFEGLYQYDSNSYPVDDIQIIDLITDLVPRDGYIPNSNPINEYRMDIDISYTNNIQCTCDTSIDYESGNCPVDIYSISNNLDGGLKVRQYFNTDCFYSQNLYSIDVNIAYQPIDGNQIQSEILTLLIQSFDGKFIESISQTFNPSSIPSNDGYHVATISFPLTSDLYIGQCGINTPDVYNWTLSCTDCSSQLSLYDISPRVVLCSTAFGMSDYKVYSNQIGYFVEQDQYASFALDMNQQTFICPAVNGMFFLYLVCISQSSI